MNLCRQCFREKATDVGFNKVGFTWPFAPYISIFSTHRTNFKTRQQLTNKTVPVNLQPPPQHEPIYHIVLGDI